MNTTSNVDQVSINFARAKQAEMAKTLLCEGILTAVEIYESAYDKVASGAAVVAAMEKQRATGDRSMIDFNSFHRKTLSASAMEADPVLGLAIYYLLQSCWYDAIDMANEHLDKVAEAERAAAVDEEPESEGLRTCK